jgi:hypothetical protein
LRTQVEPFRYRTDKERAKEVQESYKRLYIVNQGAKFIDNEHAKSTERQRIESKELGRALEFRIKPTNEIDRIKKSMAPVGVPSGCHGPYLD